MIYRTTETEVIVSLPITTPMGKIRVKRPVVGHAADPVACCSVPLAQADYLEWQISYDTVDENAPSVVPGVVLNKPQGTRYGYELVRLLVEARNLDLLPTARFNELNALIHAPLVAGIQELEQIAREEDPEAETIATQFGFRRHYLHVPNYWRVTDAYAVEVKIAAKQKAVGNQAMIFVNLPLQHCQPQIRQQPLIGRRANRNEHIEYTLGHQNVDLIYDTITAFALASVTHRNDLRMIFDALPEH